VKTLLAVKSCWADQRLEDKQRDIFLGDCKMDYRFFRGYGPEKAQAERDVVVLDVADDFFSLPFKVKEICRWTLLQGYDCAFFIDTDTYCRPERLSFPGHDYSGYFVYEPEPRAYAVGGSGYWLSARAMEYVLRYEFVSDYNDHQSMEPSKRGEDLQVGWAVQRYGIKCHKDERYRLNHHGPRRGNDYVTLHDIRQPDKGLRIPEAHAAWLASGAV
jgi:hypothetical protein